MECPEDGTDLMGDLPGRWLCPACGSGWRLDASGKVVEDDD
jgi:hypothetical protein